MREPTNLRAVAVVSGEKRFVHPPSNGLREAKAAVGCRDGLASSWPGATTASGHNQTPKQGQVDRKVHAGARDGILYVGFGVNDTLERALRCVEQVSLVCRQVPSYTCKMHASMLCRL